MLVPFSSTRGFKLKDTLVSIWYPYKFCGVGENERPWGHVEGFMFDVEWSELTVVGFYQQLITKSDVNTGRVDHVWVKGLHQPRGLAEVADLVVNDCGQGVVCEVSGTGSRRPGLASCRLFYSLGLFAPRRKPEGL